MAPGMRKLKQIDPKLAFEVWMETGSVYKTPIVLQTKYGKYNIQTGKPFSHQGVWEAANSYLLENMMEARKHVEAVWRANGVLLTDVDWYKIVLEKAAHLPRKRYDEFITKHAYLKPYMTNV